MEIPHVSGVTTIEAEEAVASSLIPTFPSHEMISVQPFLPCTLKVDQWLDSSPHCICLNPSVSGLWEWDHMSQDCPAWHASCTCVFQLCLHHSSSCCCSQINQKLLPTILLHEYYFQLASSVSKSSLHPCVYLLQRMRANNQTHPQSTTCIYCQWY